MKEVLRRSSLFLLFVGMAIFVYGAMNPFVPVFSNPSVEYKVVSTKFINVVYEPGSEYMVYEFLESCDEIYEQITSFYDVQPFSKLTVVFENDTDVVNSLADPIDNVICIFPNSSERGFFSQDMKSWVDFVFTHELTHILLTQSGGIPQIRTYGAPLSAIYNSLFIPAYLQEGLAQYSETFFNNEHGRLNDPLFEMYMRGLVLSGNFKGFGGAATYQSDGWYPIGAPYTIGGSFVRYMVETYSATVLKEAIGILSENHAQGVANAFAKATKQPFSTLVNRWIETVKNKASLQVKSVGHPTEGVQLTHSGRWTAFVNSSTSKDIYYYSEDGNEIPQLKKFDTLNSSFSSLYTLGGFLYQGGYVRSMSVSPDGKRLAFIRLVSEDGGFRNYTKCFVLNLQNRSVVKLPIRSPLFVAWLSNDQVAYSSENGGLYSIKEYDLSQKIFKTLVYPSPMVVTSMSVSRGNIYISANVNGSEDIYQLSKDGRICKIIAGDFLKKDPILSDDGKYLFFSAAEANVEGIFNIYALDIENGKFYQITNVTGGAFAPQIVGDRVFYAGYTKYGYDLFVLDKWKESSKEVELFRRTESPYKPDLNLTQVCLSVIKKGRAYVNPVGTIGSGIIPLALWNRASVDYELSGFSLLRDKLGQHNFYAVANLSTDKKVNMIRLGMINYGRYTLSAEAFMTNNRRRLNALLTYPLTFLAFERDSILYPKLGYEISSDGSGITDNFSFAGVAEFNPSFIPNNSMGVDAFQANWSVDFSPLKHSTPVYDITLSTSFPLFSNVLKAGVNLGNGTVTFVQNLGFPRVHVGLYDLTGQFGLKYIDFSQFLTYNFEKSHMRVGVQANLGFDSFLYKEFQIAAKVSYDFSQKWFRYGIRLNF